MPKLFIIDDNESRVNEILEDVERVGFTKGEVRIADNEKDAMELIASDVPDIAIVDVNLTAQLQKEGLRVIQALSDKHRGCLIICITSQGNIQLGADAIDSGASDFIDQEWAYINGYELIKQKLAIYKNLKERE